MATNVVAPRVDYPKALPPEQRPNIDHIVTEDDTPVDNIFSEKQQRLLTEPLYTSWPGPVGGRKFVALSNVGLFYAVKEPPFVPDMLLSLDVTVPADLQPKQNRSYFMWEYGKPPEMVVEVVSNREGGEDDRKLAGYAKMRVIYYVIHDPFQQLSDQVLRGYRLNSTHYEPMTEPLWFPDVELGLELWEGTYENAEDTWLRWVDQERRPIPTGAERAAREHQRAEQEHQRAEQEHQRAEQQHQRAEQERSRADKLAEQLKQFGVDPQA